MIAQMIVGLALAAAFGVDGNGKVKEEAREVAEFHAIAVGAGVQATVTLGAKASVKVEADENLLPLVRTRVEGGTLVVDAKENLNPTKPVKLTVVATKIDSAEASGGAKVTTPASPGTKFSAKASGGARLEVSGIASDECAIDTSGGAHATFAGKAKKVLVGASGGSHLDASALPAESARIDASGAAHVDLDVSGEATGSASGAARVKFKGKPQKRQIETSGAARVE